MKLLSKTNVRTISAVISTFKCAIVIELMTQQRLPLIILLHLLTQHAPANTCGYPLIFSEYYSPMLKHDNSIIFQTSQVQCCQVYVDHSVLLITISWFILIENEMNMYFLVH